MLLVYFAIIRMKSFLLGYLVMIKLREEIQDEKGQVRRSSICSLSGMKPKTAGKRQSQGIHSQKNSLHCMRAKSTQSRVQRGLWTPLEDAVSKNAWMSK